jgi:hypothetical protein
MVGRNVTQLGQVAALHLGGFARWPETTIRLTKVWGTMAGNTIPAHIHPRARFLVTSSLGVSCSITPTCSQCSIIYIALWPCASGAARTTALKFKRARLVQHEQRP